MRIYGIIPDVLGMLGCLTCGAARSRQRCGISTALTSASCACWGLTSRLDRGLVPKCRALIVRRRMSPAPPYRHSSFPRSSPLALFSMILHLTHNRDIAEPSPGYRRPAVPSSLDNFRISMEDGQSAHKSFQGVIRAYAKPTSTTHIEPLPRVLVCAILQSSLPLAGPFRIPFRRAKPCLSTLR